MRPDQHNFSRDDGEASSVAGGEKDQPRNSKRISALCFGCAKALVLGTLFVVVILVGSVLALQTGLLDGLVSNQAQNAFKKIAGETAAAQVDETVLRLTGDGKLAVEARNVDFSNKEGANQTFNIDVSRVQMKMDPISLAGGTTNISALELSDIEINMGPNNSAADVNTPPTIPKVQNMEFVIEAMFAGLEQLEMLPALRNSEEMSASNISLKHPALERFGNVEIALLEIFKTNGVLELIKGEGKLGEDAFDINIRFENDESGARKLVADINGIDVNFETNHPVPEFRSGLKTALSAVLEVKRAHQNNEAQASIIVGLEPGQLKMGGEETPLHASELTFAYDPDKKSIELMPSEIKIAGSSFPLNGGLIDSENFDGTPQNKIVYDLVVNDGRLAATDIDENAVVFSAKAFGSFDFDKRELFADELLISTGDKFAVGNVLFRFQDEGSPEISVAMDVPEIETAVAKQFWPYWLGRGTRSWASNSIFGGMLSDVKLWLHVEAGRFSNPERPIRHKRENYQVDYKFKDARVNLVGEIPPVRNAKGNMSLRGEQVVVTIDEGTSYFKSDRKLDVLGGTVTIGNTNNVPLMADIDLHLSGWADAAAELISYEPIDALDDVGIKPEEISGLMDAHVKARLGLITSQNPPAPEWQVQLDLNGVDLTKKVEGYTLTNINGVMDVDPTKAVLSASMKADGINIKAEVTEPIRGSDVEYSRFITGTINEKQREEQKLGLEDVLFGNADFKITRLSETDNEIEVDVTNSVVVAPGTGWKKSKGVAAKVDFTLTQSGDQYDISNFEFSGKGFMASGRMKLDDNGIQSANFSKVKLAPKDNYSLDMVRANGGYKFNVSGTSFDMRPLIQQIKNEEATRRKYNNAATNYDVSGKFDTVYGFGGETLTNASMRYIEKGSIAELAEFTGRTRNNGSVASRLEGDSKGETIVIASDDSGSFWRFFDIYAFVQGGSLDLQMSQKGNGPHAGKVLIRDFKVIGDERLDRLVSSRASEREKSLNEALKGRLDVSRVTFNQAIIDVRSKNGRLDILDGIVRGPQIGAAFEGKLYDKKDNTDMTGTFMPAYNLNRFFGEIPLLGALLGNGRDKALLGITFRVSGKSDNPRIQVNPLSVVAPGIFRNIFEF